MKLHEKLDSLQPYLLGIRYVEGVALVDIVIKNGWILPDNPNILKTKGGNNELNYFMLYSEVNDFGIDELLNYVETIIKFNENREKKHELLKVKAKELEELFKNNPLDKLIKMKFVLDDDKLVSDVTNDNIGLNESDTIPIISDIKPIDNSTKSTKEIFNLNVDVDSVQHLNPDESGEITEEFEHYDLDKITNNPIIKNVNGHKVELPSKKVVSIELEQFEPPSNIVCKCGPNDMCPVCMEEKGM